VRDMLNGDEVFCRSAVASFEIVIGIKTSKQKDEDIRRCKETSEMEDVIESSSDVDGEGQKLL